GVLWGVWVVPSAWASVLGVVAHGWNIGCCKISPATCCAAVAVCGGGGHTVGLPGNEPPVWGGWLLGAARLFGLLLWVAGGGIVGSLRTVQWTRASLIFVVFVVLSC